MLGVERDVGRDGAARQQGRVETGGTAYLLLAFQHGRLFRGPRHCQRRVRLQIALHVQPAQQRREVERGPSPHLKGAAGTARADRFFEIGESHARLFGNPAALMSGRAPTDLPGLEQDHLHARGGKRIRGRAPGQTAADDNDVSLRRTAVSGMSGDTRLRESIDPGGLAVSGRHRADMYRAGWRDGQDGRDGRSPRTVLRTHLYSAAALSASLPFLPLPPFLPCPSRPRSAFLRSAPHRYPPVPPDAGTTR